MHPSPTGRRFTQVGIDIVTHCTGKSSPTPAKDGSVVVGKMIGSVA
jgi:hypothetical protein